MIARYIYRHARYVALIAACILAIGINSFNSIARQEDPELTNFVGNITTFFPGATPDRVEALVTRPLEDELRKIGEIEDMSSISSSGVSFMTIRLKYALSDTELDRVWSEVRDGMADAARLFPTGAQPPLFDNDRTSSFSMIVALTSSGETDAPLSILNRVAQDLADAARNLDDTKLVVLFGEPEEEIRVEVNESALLSRGLSLRHVAETLKSADVKTASGRAVGNGADILVELSGDLDSLERVRQVIVNTSASGSATRIGDLGQVYRSAVSPPHSLALTDGKPGILVGVLMEPGAQVDVWSKRFKTMLADFRQRTPTGVSLAITYDQSIYAVERMAEVGKNLALGVALVILVLLVTLGWRAAVVVAIVLPLCGLISLSIMERTGLALQQMSVSGLIVALGLLVDGSIVMTDEIRKRLLLGQSPIEAIGGSVDRLRVPLISSALTTILAFMPMAIAPGPAGDFIGSIASAVIIMLGASTLLALVLTPVLAAWLLPTDPVQADKWYVGGINGHRLSTKLSAALDWSLRHPIGAISLALVLPISGFLSFGTLTAQFFPGTDRDQLFIQVKLADGRSIYDSLDLATRIDQKLRESPLIRRVDWSIGESPPPFYYNLARVREGIPSWAEALVLTTDAYQTNDLIRRLQTEMDSEFPGARIVVRGIDQGPPVFAPLEIEIYGPNLDILQDIGHEFRRRTAENPYVTHTTADLTGGAPKVVFELQEEKLRLSGLQLADASAALSDGLLGITGGEILEGTERMPVRVRFSEQEWESSDQIHNLTLPLNRGANPVQTLVAGVPLNAVANPTLVPSQSPISRFNGERRNVVQGFLERGILPEEALKLLRANLAEHPIELPAGYRYQFGGDSDERAAVVEDIMAPMGLILAALMATIVLTFNSWRLSAVALLVCICSMGLSLLSLAIFNYPFGIQALIGVIGSIGVSINAAIIIMTALQGHESAQRGNLFAVRSVVMDSSRHIVSTTVTTFGGFLPLILEGGEFWPPFAMAIAGGVLLSTVISFFLVPPMFVLITGRKSRTISASREDSGSTASRSSRQAWKQTT